MPPQVKKLFSLVVILIFAVVLVPAGLLCALSCTRPSSLDPLTGGDSANDAGVSAATPGPQPDFGPLLRQCTRDR